MMGCVLPVFYFKRIFCPCIINPQKSTVSNSRIWREKALRALQITQKFTKLPSLIVLEADRHYRFPIHDLIIWWKPPVLLPRIARTRLPLLSAKITKMGTKIAALNISISDPSVDEEGILRYVIASSLQLHHPATQIATLQPIRLCYAKKILK
ncbi:hypothetical protein AFLA70_645g000412 [Aspergillus flavus AF70]|nr:hypothetical protein AFLA70_645g000412 [Aspergillus flavus AF70]